MGCIFFIQSSTTRRTIFRLLCGPIAATVTQDKTKPATGRKKRGKERSEKPWDDASVDHWKEEEFKPGEMKNPLLEESSFATLFPRYREKYLKEIWSIVTEELKKVWY